MTTDRELREIPIGQIDRNPGQPRKHFDAQALSELASSITENGLLQPITVRPIGERFIIIAGERRWRASQEAGLDTIPAIVRTDLDDERAYVLSVLENVSRADMTVIEEGAAYQELIGHGHTLAEVASMMGKSELHITRRIDLLRLDEQYRHLAASGQMGTMLAWNVSRLSRDGQRQVIQKVVAGDFPSDWEAVRFAAAVYGREQQPDLFSIQQDEMEIAVSQKRRERKNEVERAWQKVEAMGDALRVLLEADAAELASALGSDVEMYQQRAEILHRTTTRLRATMTNAVAMRQAGE